MKNDLITIKEYCIHYEVEPSFINELEELGLVQVLQKEDEKYIDSEQLSDLESYNRMFYDLEINTAGIDAIHHLLGRIRAMQDEMLKLKNRLRFYE